MEGIVAILEVKGCIRTIILIINHVFRDSLASFYLLELL